MVATGILISGRLEQVEGLTVYAPADHGGPSWAFMSPGDYQMRRTPWIRQVIPHSVFGDWPMPIKSGAGAPGRAKYYAEMWQEDPTHAGGHFFVDTNGDIYGLADVARIAAYHAENSNNWSIGIEHCQSKLKEMFQATIDAGVRFMIKLCQLFDIPLQMPLLAYHDQPIKRFYGADGKHNGGPDVVGIIPHRANTFRRGRGDPGDALLMGLAKAGVRQLDYDAGEDIELGKRRQLELNRLDSKAGHTYRPLDVDGILGPSSNAAMHRHCETWEELAI